MGTKLLAPLVYGSDILDVPVRLRPGLVLGHGTSLDAVYLDLNASQVGISALWVCEVIVICNSPSLSAYFPLADSLHTRRY